MGAHKTRGMSLFRQWSAHPQRRAQGLFGHAANPVKTKIAVGLDLVTIKPSSSIWAKNIKVGSPTTRPWKVAVTFPSLSTWMLSVYSPNRLPSR